MALPINQVKQQLRELREEKSIVERKIRALEEFLGIPKGGSNGTPVARVEVDLTPTVETIFVDNNNVPIKKKVLVDMLAKQHPEIDRAVVESKLINVTRKILVQDGYGKYRLNK